MGGTSFEVSMVQTHTVRQMLSAGQHWQRIYADKRGSGRTDKEQECSFEQKVSNQVRVQPRMKLGFESFCEALKRRVV